jgi:hypothetical protein
MSRARIGGNAYLSLVAAIALLWPSNLCAQNRYSENTALLAISIDKGRVTAGMMCAGSDSISIDHAGSPPNCEKFKTPPANMSRRSSWSILNPDVLAFDVTSWPWQSIAELESRLQLMDDPLNYDFSKARLARLQVRRIDETQGEYGLQPSNFEFGSGCYLLMIAPKSVSVPAS